MMKNNEEKDNKDRQKIKDFFLIPTIKAFEMLTNFNKYNDKELLRTIIKERKKYV